MTLRFGEIYNEGFYHIFNRGTDKRIIFCDKQDYERFLMLMNILNSNIKITSVTSMKQGDFDMKLQEVLAAEPLVDIFAYNLLPNHFHFVLKQKQENGVSIFMRKLGMAYAKYFNAKYERIGTLFQGRYKYIEIDNETHLRRIICYVNRNHQIHGFSEIRHRESNSHDIYMGVVPVKHAKVRGGFDEGILLFVNGDSYGDMSQEYAEQVLRQREYEN